eukprot:4122838-Prorocentrum_lima.AAC.1
MGARGGLYALKLQTGEWHETSNKLEYELSLTPMSGVMPRVFSLCQQQLGGIHWSVLCVEKVEGSLHAA